MTLYYNDDEGYLNPFLCVDRNYTHEVHAYNLLTEFQGDLVPKFFLILFLESSCQVRVFQYPSHSTTGSHRIYRRHHNASSQAREDSAT